MAPPKRLARGELRATEGSRRAGAGAAQDAGGGEVRIVRTGDRAGGLRLGARRHAVDRRAAWTRGDDARSPPPRRSLRAWTRLDHRGWRVRVRRATVRRRMGAEHDRAVPV